MKFAAWSRYELYTELMDTRRELAAFRAENERLHHLLATRGINPVTPHQWQPDLIEVGKFVCAACGTSARATHEVLLGCGDIVVGHPGRGRGNKRRPGGLAGA